MDELLADILRVIVQHLPAANGDTVRDLLQKIEDAVAKKSEPEPEKESEPEPEKETESDPAVPAPTSPFAPGS